VLRSAVWTYGRATARARSLPGFLIIGAQKAGTTALYAYLRWHPAVLGPSWKEVSFFDRHYSRGEAWYRGQFPNALRLQLVERRSGARPIVGEASPSYLFHPLAPERVAALLPGARLVALVRNPVERAFSHYQHEVALGREPLSFEDALAREEDRTRGEVDRMLSDPRYFSRSWWNYTYAARGLYGDQLDRWLAVFPREQLLIVPTDDLAATPAETYVRVLEFLGVPPHALGAYPRIFSRDYAAMRPETHAALVRRFEAPNRRLYELLGRDLGWR
jgi:Sulfotransferase domain